MLKTLRSTASRFRSEDAGAVLVEMTLLTPFLLLLSAGVFEFSNILHTRLLIEAGIEDGARYMARCSDPSLPAWSTCVANGKNLAVNGAVSGGTARVSGWSTTDLTVTWPAFAAWDANGVELYLSGTGSVNVVQVSTTYAYTGTGLLAYLGYSPLTLTVSHQERVFGW